MSEVGGRSYIKYAKKKLEIGQKIHLCDYIKLLRWLVPPRTRGGLWVKMKLKPYLLCISMHFIVFSSVRKIFGNAKEISVLVKTSLKHHLVCGDFAD